MSSNSIPSEDDFRKASQVLRNRSRGLSDVRERILLRFEDQLHEFFLLDCTETAFRAYVFYPRTGDVEDARRTGLQSRICDAVYEELENVGRGARNNINIEFEFDSHENVEQNYAGNYFNRLR